MMTITRKFYPLKILGKVAIQLCFFFYLYSVPLVILPFGIGTRIALALCGLTILIFNIQKESENKKNIYVTYDYIQYVLIFGIIICISLVTILFNQTRDFLFVQYPLLITFIFLACYFLHFLIIKVHKTINYYIITRYIAIAVLMQVLISLISFLSPAVQAALMHLQNLADLDTSKISESGSYRLIGFGSTFFGAGLINGFALMCLAMLIKSGTLKGGNFLLYSLIFFLILLLGVMMARTTLVGFGLAMLYLFMPSFTIKKSNFKNNLKFLSLILLIPSLTILMINIFSPQILDELTAALNFGFELFINYFNKGELTTKSTTALQSMYVFPSSFKTYLIGDARFYINPGDPSEYYMHTDVGYLRLIYYFGIPGMMCYLVLQYRVIRNAVKRSLGNKSFERFLFLCFLYCLILNTKAFTDLIFLVMLFCYPPKHAAYNSLMYNQINNL